MPDILGLITRNNNFMLAKVEDTITNALDTLRSNTGLNATYVALIKDPDTGRVTGVSLAVQRDPGFDKANEPDKVS